MKELAKLLFVEDDQDFADATSLLLRRSGFSVRVCGALTEARQALSQERFDLMLADWSLPDGSSPELIVSLAETQQSCAAIVLTAHNDAPMILQAMRAGAVDFLTKPIRHAELVAAIGRVLGHSPSPQAPKVRTSLIWQQTQSMLRAAANAPKTTILLRGESGVGKEVAAAQVHQMSARSRGPYITTNAACLPAELLESELFGHEAGAFTGAQRAKRGLLELSDGGTLFLDEIGELPLSLQAKLLRVLDGHPFRRLGGEKEIVTNFRLICATNAPLEELIRRGTFRSDLYHRIKVLEITLPPLRARTSDIEALALHFLKSLAPELGVHNTSVSAGALAALRSYHWPGNIRELRNAIERALIVSAGGEIQPQHLPEELSQTQPALSVIQEQDLLDESLEAGMRRHIVEVFERSGRNLTHAATRLKISRTTLRKYLQDYGICAAKN